MRYDKHWLEKYQIVREYIETHPGKLPHKDVVYKNIKIRYWLFNQRRLLKRKLTEESRKRLKLLKELNVPVSFEHNVKSVKKDKPKQLSHEQNWYRRYAELQAYIQKNMKIPNSRQHPALFMWISRQRKKLSAGKLTEDQMQKLSNIGIIDKNSTV